MKGICTVDKTHEKTEKEWRKVEMKDGILVIDKPQNFTSHDVVARVRKIIGTKKVGHTGTLDPMATGVLVVCVGAATKLVEHFTSKDKIYEATIKLGIKTDTADITGKIIEEKTIPLLEEQFVNEVCQKMIGKQKQIPPMYSSIKVNGMKLYEYARKGIEVKVEPREIEIFAIDNIKLSGEEISYCVHCSKGTYVRTLCETIAENLGTCGTMSSLRRIKTGEFSIEQAVSLEEISEEKIIPMEKLFDKKIILEKDLEKLLNGMTLPCERPDGLYSLYTNHYIGIGRIKDKKLKREIIL